MTLEMVFDLWGYWSPYALALAAAFLALVSALPALWPGVGLRRWYQRLTVAAWLLAAGVVALTMTLSSPWLIAGIVLAGLAVAAVVGVQRQMANRLTLEALAFLQALGSLMAGGDPLAAALRRAAQDADLTRLYPRMIAQTREIVGYLDARRPLSEAVERIAESALPAARRIWSQIAVLAHLAEDEGEGISVEAQRDTLQSLWSILNEVHNINEEMKREMSLMQAAKWLFTAIVPGMNLYLYLSLPFYATKFLVNPLGQAALVLEVLTMIVTFVIFSRLAQIPEVRL